MQYIAVEQTDMGQTSHVQFILSVQIFGDRVQNKEKQE